MPVPTCTQCRRVIPAAEINVGKDVAYCRECNVSYRLSDLTGGGLEGGPVDLNHPPAGAWYHADGSGTVMGATNRSWGMALGSLVFAVFWNGILSIFLAVAVAGTLKNLHLSVPAWFPAPVMNDSPMSGGMTLFLWLFLTPFILVGLFMIGVCLSSWFGHTEVRLDHQRGVVFTGVGGWGWKRSFDASAVTDVRSFQKHNSEGADTFGILIETRAGKQVKLATLLTNERRQFVLRAARQVLLR